MEVLYENKEKMKHKCKFCGSIYLYTARDVDYYWHPTMKCPICNNVDSPSIFDKKVKTNE